MKISENQQITRSLLSKVRLEKGVITVSVDGEPQLEWYVEGVGVFDGYKILPAGMLTVETKPPQSWWIDMVEIPKNE